MLKMLEDIEGIEVVVDNILNMGENDNQHNSRLVKVLEWTKHQNLKLNKEKCQVKKLEVPYLGHILSKEGLKPDPKNSGHYKHGITNK